MVNEKSPLLHTTFVNISPLADHGQDNNNMMECLSLEELLPFLDDPWWKNLRKFLVLIFWIGLITTFTIACSLSLTENPLCPLNGVNSFNRTLLSALDLGNDSLSRRASLIP